MNPLFNNPGRATPQIKVEFMFGDDIIAACTEAVRIAKTVGCMVVFDFNGVHCMAWPETDPQALADRWSIEVKKPPEEHKVTA